MDFLNGRPIRRFRESRTIRLTLVISASLVCYFLMGLSKLRQEGLSPELLAGAGLNILGSVVFVALWDFTIEKAAQRKLGSPPLRGSNGLSEGSSSTVETERRRRNVAAPQEDKERQP
jgi:hypothetical protein